MKLEHTADCSIPAEMNQPLDLVGLSLKINTEGKEWRREGEAEDAGGKWESAQQGEEVTYKPIWVWWYLFCFHFWTTTFGNVTNMAKIRLRKHGGISEGLMNPCHVRLRKLKPVMGPIKSFNTNTLWDINAPSIAYLVRYSLLSSPFSSLYHCFLPLYSQHTRSFPSMETKLESSRISVILNGQGSGLFPHFTPLSTPTHPILQHI